MRVVLISGEPAFRFGFRAAIEPAADVTLVADAADARAGFRAVDEHEPDVVVMDVSLRGMNGTAATREVKRRAPSARVLLLASWPRERDVLEGFAAGADGFALKTESLESLLQAIRTVGHGNRYLTPEVRGLAGESARAIERSQSSGVAADVLDVLSAREREVLELVIKGWRNRDMARELCVSIKTIDTHRTRINRKLNCRSSAELIRFAAENGLLRPPPAGPTTPGPTRTVVVLVDDDPKLRAALLRDVALEGCKEKHTSSVAGALAESLNTPEPELLVIDRPGVPGVRAIASLPDGDGARFIAAVDHATREAYPSDLPVPTPGNGHVARPAPPAPWAGT